MATKHFFSDTSGVVVLGLESLVSRNNHLALDVPNKVVYSKTHTPSKVSVISGGGSGHEPAWSGYVGDGMLAAAVNGEVFASPSTKQVMAAVEHVPSDAGIILCITNYTGDNLHFGLAREKAVGLGYKIGMLKMTDDVGLGRKQTENLGRRGLAGNMFVLKLCGAASQEGYAFEKCFALGQSVNDHCVTIGSSLDYCHIPGRGHHEQLPPNTLSVAQGIHNEAGLLEVSPIPSADDLVTDLLRYLLDPSDKDRAFCSFSSSDDVALLINNFGGVSNFELEALTSTTLKLLARDWKIQPKRIFAQPFETSLNAPGWSISLLNISSISAQVEIPTSTIFALLDRETSAPAWPRNGYVHAVHTPVSDSNKEETKIQKKMTTATPTGPQVSPKILEHALRTACKQTMAAEPDITKWDTVMGDGDCGEAVVGMCKSVLADIDAGVCAAHDGHLLPILDRLCDNIEDVGGSLAAIISILLASFTSALKQASSSDGSSGSASRDSHDGGSSSSSSSSSNRTRSAHDSPLMEKRQMAPLPSATQPQTQPQEALFAAAAASALTNLQSYTSARAGGRTVMDALIPFCATFRRTGRFGDAVRAADEGARATEGMKARFGRAVYVGENRAGGGEIPMDPGAWAAAVFLRGLDEGLQGR
ncbi:hypothetical protein MBLNU459_g6427t3 [Dothideomycetes sp. NU459]